MSGLHLRGIYLRLAGALMLVVVAALAAMSYFSHRTFEAALAPEMAKKVASGGASARALVLRAMEHQIPFRELYGIEQTFDELKASIPEIAYVAITDAEGSVLYQRFKSPAGAPAHFRSAATLAALAAPERAVPAVHVGDQYLVSLPIVTPAAPVGMLHIGIGVDFVDRIVLDMLFDVIVVLIVALFIALELLNFMAGLRIEAALRSLARTVKRGAAGDFTTAPAAARDAVLGGIVGRLEAMRARVTAGHDRLVSDIEAGRRGPAHERPPGLAAAHSGLQVLTSRYRFGRADVTSRGDEEGHLAKIRAPLFLFILAEELTRPFLPGYVKSLLVPIPGLSPAIVVGLPIALFMLIVALAQPFLGAYCERVGNRRTMLIGACVAALGFVASAFAVDVLDLLLWRSLCAAGYAMVFVAGQNHVLEHATIANRPRSFALFVGAIMVATVCGPSIGGILADNIGERLTFGVAALLALGSTAAIRLLPAHAPSAAQRAQARPPTLREIGTLMVNRRFMTVTGLAAIPAKVLLTGMGFYLVPLYVVSMGSTQTVVGRILMVYGVVMVVVSPLAAAVANTRARMEWLVGGGLLLSGAGGLLVLAGGGVGWVFAAIALVGLGQSLSIAAQSALVREHCDAEVAAMGEPAVYGVYRLLERFGNALGPLIAGALVLAVGYRTSFVVIGAAVVLCGAAFVLATRRAAVPPQLVPA